MLCMVCVSMFCEEASQWMMLINCLLIKYGVVLFFGLMSCLVEEVVKSIGKN